MKVEYSEFKDFYNKDFTDLFFCKKTISVVAWAKMYKKEIFDSIRYPDGMNYEDAYIITDICDNIKTGVAVVKKSLYNYLRYRQGSITKSFNQKKFQVLIAHRRCIDRIKKGSNAYKYACKILFYRYGYLYKIMKNTEFEDKLIEQFKADYEKYNRYLPLKTRLRFYIFKNFRKLYCILWK